MMNEELRNIEYHNSVIFPLTDITAHHKYYNELTTYRARNNAP